MCYSRAATVAVTFLAFTLNCFTFTLFHTSRDHNPSEQEGCSVQLTVRKSPTLRMIPITYRLLKVGPLILSGCCSLSHFIHLGLESSDEGRAVKRARPSMQPTIEEDSEEKRRCV